MIRRMAYSIRASEAALLAYLQQPPALSGNAAYRAAAQPTASKQKIPFEAMIQSDTTLTEEQKVEWLSIH